MSFDRIWRGYGAFLKACGLIAGLMTLGMMVLVVCNAIGRYALNSPINGAFEVTQSMLTVLVFLSLAFTQFHDQHIRVVLIADRLPAGLRTHLRVATLLLGAVFFAWCTWGTWGFAMESYRIGEEEWGSIRYPIWPIKFVVCFGLLLLAIQFVLSAIRQYREPDLPSQETIE